MPQQIDSSGESRTPWTGHPSLPSLPRLEGDLTVDACVVGAGISGLSVAYQLSRRGLSVVVLEAGDTIASGETGRTTAHLSDALDNGLLAIERMHGKDGARTCVESHRSAIDEIERTVESASISCDFERVDGFLFLGSGDDIGLLGMELAASQRAGMNDVRLIENPEGLFAAGPSLRYPRQAQMQPLEYVAGLARAATTFGARIFGGAHVETVNDGSPARVGVRGGHTVTASNVIVATGTPINDRLTIHTKQVAFRTYAIGAIMPRQEAPHALYWDTSKPYHYVRIEAGAPGAADDILIVGGEDHETGRGGDAEEAGARWDRLIAWARERFPMMKDVAYKWSGQVMEPADGVAFIGRNPGDEHVYIVTGDSGQGMTHSTIAGLLIADLVTGKEHPWSSLYDPSRLPLRALEEFSLDNLHAVAAYRGWFTPGDVEQESEIASGDGAILRRGLTKIACYRDAGGTLHERSATCPHLGAILTWNRAEKTWDCPAHGSRFDAVGHVINGPANDDLGPINAARDEPRAAVEASGR